MATAMAATAVAAAAKEPASAQISAEEAAQKKNTDCVYFLASPLTCKKGVECEFRHSENARVNPRDCWFWLSGNCLNRDCSFRHPPLESRPQAAEVSNKGRTPCYFYSQGYCAKGDRCPFMHGVVPLPISQPPKPVSVPEPSDKEVNSAEIATLPKPAIDIQLQTAPEAGPLEVVTASKQSAPAGPVQNGNLPGKAEMRSEQISSHLRDHEEVDLTDTRVENGTRETEDRWEESSPGFDVLVDDGPEQMHYGDEADFHPNHEEAGRHFENDLDAYDYEYSEVYPQAGGFEAGGLFDRVNFDHYDQLRYEHGSYEQGDYEHVGYDATFDHVDYDRPRYEHSDRMDRGPRGGSYNGRMEHSIKERLSFAHREGRPFLDNGDLRNHLEKRRRRDSMDRYPRRERSHREFQDSQRLSDDYERQCEQRRHQPYLQPSRSNNRRSRERDSGGRRYESSVDVGEPAGLRSHRSRSYSERSSKDVAPPVSETRSSRQGFRKTEARNDGSDFAAPKTLAQIRAEKRKHEGEDVAGSSKKRTGAQDVGYGWEQSQGFDAPRPLQDILKQKGKVGDEYLSDSSAQGGPQYFKSPNGIDYSHVGAENPAATYKPEPEDELIDDEDDDDDFAKKLGGLFS